MDINRAAIAEGFQVSSSIQQPVARCWHSMIVAAGRIGCESRKDATPR
jgi:hypothetical protein